VLDRLTTLFYWLNIRTWVTLIMLWAARIKTEGLGHFPRKGRAILVSNHFNLADPPVLTYVMPRRVVWMAKQELFDIPVAGWLFRGFGLIPVRRFEGDLKALRKAQNALRRGHVLGMFPEGHRSAGKGLQPAEPGTAFIALRTGAPIVPVAIWGTEGIKLPWAALRFGANRIRVRFGHPFQLPETKRATKDQIEAGTREIMEKIAELLPAKYHGVYAAPDVGGHHDAPVLEDRGIETVSEKEG
jgi:1-acyl-sn-glycerol-3-phosphate acyltransferase